MKTILLLADLGLNLEMELVVSVSVKEGKQQMGNHMLGKILKRLAADYLQYVLAFVMLEPGICIGQHLSIKKNPSTRNRTRMPDNGNTHLGRRQ